MTAKEKERLIELAKACQENAAHCEGNVLLAAMWVEESFSDLAQRLLELADAR